jgi:hypothetical protein
VTWLVDRVVTHQRAGTPKVPVQDWTACERNPGSHQWHPGRYRPSEVESPKENAGADPPAWLESVSSPEDAQPPVNAP